MRWEQLFADLDARFDQLADDQLSAELADRQRVAVGAVPLTARLAGAIAHPVRLRTTSGAVSGVLRQVGPDWALVREVPGREALVNLSAVTVIEGLTAATGRPPTGIGLRLNLRHMLRGIARDRSPVMVSAPGSDPSGTDISGTIDRLGADFLELAVHAPWEARRAAAVRSVVAIPLGAVAVVRAIPLG